VFFFIFHSSFQNISQEAVLKTNHKKQSFSSYPLFVNPSEQLGQDLEGELLLRSFGVTLNMKL